MSGYTWPVPDAPGDAVSPQEAEAKIFGSDIWHDLSLGTLDRIVTPAGDWKLVSGMEALRQSLLRRMLTNPGEWQTLPEYGCGARKYIKAKNTPAVRAELTARIKQQFLRDDRVEKVKSVAMEIQEGVLRIRVTVIPKGAAQRSQPLIVAADLA